MRKHFISMVLGTTLAAGAFLSCTYDYDAKLDSDADILVVEGDIIVGGKTVVTLSKMHNFSEEGTSYVDAHEAWIEDEGGQIVSGPEISYTAPVGTVSLNTESLSSDRSYRLCLRNLENGDRYQTSLVRSGSSPRIDSLSIWVDPRIRDKNRDWSEEYFVNLMVSFHSDDSNPYFSVVYEGVWETESYANTMYEYLPDLNAIVDGWKNPNRYCWVYDPRTTIPVSTESFSDNRMVDFVFNALSEHDRRLSACYRVDVSVYSVPEDSYRYQRNLDEISFPDGDLFTPTPSSMRGNIMKVGSPETPVLGYIGAATQEKMTLWVMGSEMYVYRTDPSIQRMLSTYTIGEGFEDYLKDNENWYDLYLRGYRPYEGIFSEGSMSMLPDYYSWISSRCLDCMMQSGATRIRPDYWPNNHF